MVAFSLGARESLSILLYAPELELRIKLEHEIITEIVGHSTTVARAVARDGVLVDIVLDGRTFVEGIYDDTRDAVGAFRKGKPYDGGTFRRSNLSPYVIVGKIDLIVIGTRILGLVREPACPLLFIVNPVWGCLANVGKRHDRELSVVVNPRRGLVCLLDAADLILGIDILPAVPIAPSLWCPEVHTPGQGDGRVGVTCG